MQTFAVAIGVSGGMFSVCQSLGQNSRKLRRDFLRRKRTLGLIPHADPIDGARDGEGGDFRIAGRDGAVLYPLFDEGSQAAIDFSFAAAHLDERFGGEVPLV